MEIRMYIRMLQRGWWIILLTALVALNIALASSFLTTPIYQASARFVVSPNPSLFQGQAVVTSLEALDKRSIVSTYAEFLNSERIYTDTLTSFNIDAQTALKYTHNTVVLPDANILELTVEGPDAQRVAALANTTGERAVAEIKRLYQVYDISVLDPATVPVIPIRPQPLRDALLAVALGLVLGATLAILREQIRIPIEAYRNRRSVDVVSNALSKRFFLHRLEDEITRSPREELSLGLVQLDGLRDLSDSLPQPMLQNLLRKVTDMLRRELRGNDIIGRWADISYVLMLPTTPTSAANRTMDRIRAALSETIGLEDLGEELKLLPVVSTVTRESNETASELVERLQKGLEKAA